MTSTHLLLASDGSEQSLAAARLVRNLFAPTALARITVLAVVPPFEAIPFYGMSATYGGAMVSQDLWNGVIATAEKTAQDTVQRTLAELHSAAPVETVVLHGIPADVIVRYAKEHHVGLIVMGSRGWGEVHALLLGSVSERVLHTAHCPVLLARPTESPAS